MTVWVANNLLAQMVGEQQSDYARWVAVTEPGPGDDMLHKNGASENLAWLAEDFEICLEAYSAPALVMKAQLMRIVELPATSE